MHFASKGCHFDIIKILAEARADMKIEDENVWFSSFIMLIWKGNCPFLIAVQHNFATRSFEHLTSNLVSYRSLVINVALLFYEISFALVWGADGILVLCSRPTAFPAARKVESGHVVYSHFEGKAESFRHSTVKFMLHQASILLLAYWAWQIAGVRSRREAEKKLDALVSRGHCYKNGRLFYQFKWLPLSLRSTRSMHRLL